MTKDKIKASHILVMHNESRDSRSDITREKAKKSIDQIYKSVLDGKTTFGDAAVKHSDCSSSEHGGDLGEFGRGMMVKSFEDVAFSLDINEISEPFEAEFGYHIVKREE